MMRDETEERLVDKLLAHIERNGADDRLRELAHGVRQGEVSIADTLRASSYADALSPGLDSFIGWYHQLSESERAEQAVRSQTEIDRLRTAEDEQ